jgi:adenine-specific DNA-methyltransferase
MDMEYSALEKGDFDQVSPAKPWAWNLKWTHLFLSPHDRSLVDQWWPQLDWKPFRAYASVEVGVVTGDNRFFVLNQERASRFDRKHLVPVVTSAKDLRGIRFDAADFRQVLLESRPAFLLNVGEPVDGLPQPLRAYLEEGRKHRVHTRYKCRIREPWYAVPSVWECDALLLRQSGEMPRLVHLAKKCTATDTVHRVTWRRRALGRRHAVSFMNTWTLLASELTGRSYGGGVLELMPSEANRLPLPEPKRELDALFDKVDERIRSRKLYDAVALVDEVVMPEWMSADQCEAAESILANLVRRRKTRHHDDH